MTGLGGFDGGVPDRGEELLRMEMTVLGGRTPDDPGCGLGVRSLEGPGCGL